jgi:outer membrane biosynthesis protein TonB
MASMKGPMSPKPMSKGLFWSSIIGLAILLSIAGFELARAGRKGPSAKPKPSAVTAVPGQPGSAAAARPAHQPPSTSAAEPPMIPAGQAQGSTKPVSDLAYPGRLPSEVIKSTIQKNVTQLKTCYDQQLAKNPDLEGRMKIHFTIEEDGTVSGAGVEDGEMANRKLRECLEKTVSRMTFPASKAGKTQITYPLMFKASPPQAP